MRGYGDPAATEPSRRFDTWLAGAATRPPEQRTALLAHWDTAPAARFSHPREEHLLPLMVAAGASNGPGTRIYNEIVMGTAQSAFRYD